MEFVSMLEEIILNKSINFKSEKDIMRMLSLTGTAEKRELKEKLLSFLQDGTLLKTAKNKYVLPSAIGAIRGKIMASVKDYAFFRPNDKTLPDLFLPRNNLFGALNGDEVFCVKENPRDKSSDVGLVYSILERKVSTFVGLVTKFLGKTVVSPDDKKLPNTFIARDKMLSAKLGDKVVVRITDYPTAEKFFPDGEIIEVLGNCNDEGIEELSIIKNYGLDLDFPEEVKAMAKSKNKEIEEKDIKNRRDFRDKLTITIDGEDARDFDDAISIEILENGNYLLGVHIADVSYYVTEKSPLDEEALARATSVYFPNRVIPMLPFDISNGICSLQEGKNRFTMSALIEIDKTGKTVKSEMCEGVIKSDHRMTYTSVTKMLEGDKEEIEKYSDIYDMVLLLKELALILMERKKSKGSIDLDIKESLIMVDENGNISVELQDRDISHKIIEEFMILANECVAEYLTYLEMPMVYRIHEKPDPEKTETFINYLKELGIKVKFTADKLHPKHFQTLLEELEGSPLKSLVNKVMLRSMKKAKYYPENVGHFGLSSDCYCHFTSPIRRYPDLVVHRILRAVLRGESNIYDRFNNFVYKASDISTRQEKNADEVEREMDEFYKCRFLKDKVGEEYQGIISGVTSFGVFVELKNTIEGLIRLDTLPFDSYTFDESRFILRGKRHIFKLGDEIEIKVANVDLSTRKIEFVLSENDKRYNSK